MSEELSLGRQLRDGRDLGTVIPTANIARAKFHRMTAQVRPTQRRSELGNDPRIGMT